MKKGKKRGGSTIQERYQMKMTSWRNIRKKNKWNKMEQKREGEAAENDKSRKER